MAADHHVALGEGQRLAGGDAQLQTDDVDAGHQFGDGVLDLHAGVHLDEVELAVLVQELERAGAAVADRGAGLADLLAHGLALLRGDARRWRFLDDLLPAALQRAVAFAQRDHVAVVVADHLELDVPGLLEEFLHVDRVVAEGRESLGLGDVDRIEKRPLAVHDAHAAAAAAARGLDDDRVADRLGDAEALVRIGGQGAVGARHAGHPGLVHGRDRRDLVAHEADGLALRPDEHEAGFFHALGEVRVLGQEAVAGMDSHRVRDLGSADDRGHVEVAVPGLRRPDADGLVGEQHVLEGAVGGRVHGHRLDAELAARPQDAERYLAAIRDDYLVEHRLTRSRTAAARTRPARRS